MSPTNNLAIKQFLMQYEKKEEKWYKKIHDEQPIRTFNQQDQ